MAKFNSILVSIAMCSYNGEYFIREQIDSILSQTYKNIELIIVDDGSTDSTIEIIKSYLDTDNRVKLYQNQKNLGYVKNFEKAISLCKGEFIALSDQDDIWKEKKIEIFLNQIKENILIYSDALLIDKEKNTLKKELIRPKNNLVKGSCNKSFLFTNCVSGNTLMFKKELTKHILPIPDAIKFHDSWIAFIASSYGNITYTDESMIYYRRYSEQVTAKVDKKYNNFNDKFNQKKALMVKNINIDLAVLQEYYKVSVLDDEIKFIIKSLIKHLQNYEECYFNYSIYKLLSKYKTKIFAIRKNKYRRKRILRLSLGLKLHKILLFSL